MSEWDDFRDTIIKGESKTMTPDEQRIAIAKACGWKNVTNFGNRPMGTPPECKSILYHTDLPNYHLDLNAMHDAERTLIYASNIDQQSDYIAWLNKLCPSRKDGINDRPFCLVTAAASTRAEAFLRAKGKWKD